MATILLAAAGSAVGGAFGGGLLGVSSAVIGRAVGATVGRVIDQAILGAGSKAVETGRIDRFRLTGASEGAPVAQVYGRSRVAGQVIWASRFVEHSERSGGSGKGGPTQPETKSFSYTVSLAIALCEGEITRVGRIWADGTEVTVNAMNLRVYRGTEDQLPDPKIEAVEGQGQAPAYRGIAYVVIEDLSLAAFGNRVPQFNFEVMRPEQPGTALGLARGIEAVALIPGTGEYALATTPVHFAYGPGTNRSANVHSPSGGTDFETSLTALAEELPNWHSTSLVVSWFGDDLRCGSCRIQPKVEQTEFDGVHMPWSVSDLRRSQAAVVATLEGRPVYGGTPADRSVIQAIRGLKDRGSAVMFYPFILMEQLVRNGRPDPWNVGADQPPLPWRGRITCSVAPGSEGTVDGTEAARAEVAAFFGEAAAHEFSATTNGVAFTGSDGWSYRRFILHYAHLCKAAGGVDAFCIGSEMRGLTQVRGPDGSFPAVEAFRALAAEVRSILGAEARIGYAADWSEYFGYRPQDGSGDVFFHLDPLWADPNIDFIGIDNYMPLSDWRDGRDHADAGWGAIYNLQYLKANIAGGEGYDWFYATPEDAEAQRRTPITDGAHGESWVYRYKDLASWWSNTHHDRIGGVRLPEPTDWVPGSKPIWFTELGCAAVDKATNEPNKFVDPKSSESALPRYSSGRRDDLIQMQYIRAHLEFWRDRDNNPVSPIYGQPMVDTSRLHLWAWDARPYPHFPAQLDLWSDGVNYARGHWLNGRVSSRGLADVVAEICARSGVTRLNLSGLYGLVRGYGVNEISGARSVLQPLMTAFGFDAVERDGQLVFRSRDGVPRAALTPDMLAVTRESEGDLDVTRAPAAETAGRLRLTFVEAEADYEARAVEAVFPDEATYGIAQTEMPLVLTAAEGRRIVERWLAESRIARDRAAFALPLSRLDLGAGDVLRLPDGDDAALFRIDRVEQGSVLLLEAVRVEPEVYEPSDSVGTPVRLRPFRPALPVHPVFLDLPLIRGDEEPHAPHIAVHADPWLGQTAVYDAPADHGYRLNSLVAGRSTIGLTGTPLAAAEAGVPDLGPPLEVNLLHGTCASASWADVLNGANLFAIGDPEAGPWELFQFAEAALLSPGRWALSRRLRGQLGTDGVMPPVWPAGSTVVAIDGAPRQIALAPAARGLSRDYRIGPASRSYQDQSYTHLVRAFEGVGLRPYAPVHLRARRDAEGAVLLTWVRRTRIDGDSWEGLDVPLGETEERYLVRFSRGGEVFSEATSTAPVRVLSAAELDALGPLPITAEVAQVSDRFGTGPFRRIEIE